MPNHTPRADTAFLLSGQIMAISSVLMASQCKSPEGNVREGRRKSFGGTPGGIMKLPSTWTPPYKHEQPDPLRY